MTASDTAAQLFTTGAAALRAGDRTHARELLGRAVRADPSNARAWLWLAAAVDERMQRRECLERALQLDPGLDAARRALAEVRNAEAQHGESAHTEAPNPQPAADSPRPATNAPPLANITPQASEIGPQTSGIRPQASNIRPDYLNPWRWIWSRPAAALRSAIFTRNLLETIFLGGLAGAYLIFVWAAVRRIGAEIQPIEIGMLALALGGPLGALILFSGGLLLAGAGHRLGGRGSSGTVRAALAWAGLPLIAGLALWIGQLIFLTDASFGGSQATAFSIVLAWICATIHLALAAWSGMLSVIGVAEAHRFGFVRAAATWVLAGILVIGGALAMLAGAALLIDMRGG
ncbi:MAG: YIP1 family protein [Oscillochloris sp.]|nr:YIP1 family protein [Oscillochloris sp.]